MSQSQRVYAVRGAVCAASDTRTDIVNATTELVMKILEVNSLAHDDLVSMIFTATSDISTEFPAAAVRLAGIDVPLLCARELEVSSQIAMPMCIRVMIHCYADSPPTPVYLGETARLRDTPEPL